MNTLSKGNLPATSGLARVQAAFTLIELMMVISIIALLAALIVWGTSAAGDKKVRARVTTELAGLQLAIDDYHKTHGFYPPSNTNNVALPPLYYELTGQDATPAIANYFGAGGIVNSEKKNFMRELRSGAFGVVTTINNTEARALVVPYKGPRGDPNTWCYNSFNPTNNPESYDLWAEVVIKDKIVTLGNWKD